MSGVLLYKEPLTTRTTYTELPVKPLPYNVDRLMLTYNIASLAGTTPSIIIGMLVIDDNGNKIFLPSTAPITAVGTGVFHLGPNINNVNLPIVVPYFIWLNIQGTAPSISAQVCLYGLSTYQ